MIARIALPAAALALALATGAAAQEQIERPGLRGLNEEVSRTETSIFSLNWNDLGGGASGLSAASRSQPYRGAGKIGCGSGRVFAGCMLSPAAPRDAGARAAPPPRQIFAPLTTFSYGSDRRFGLGMEIPRLMQSLRSQFASPVPGQSSVPGRGLSDFR